MAAQMKVDRDEFAALVAQDWTNVRLAAHFEVSLATVSRVRRELGLSRPPEADPVVLARAADLLADGASYKETRRTTGLSLDTLRAHFPGQGWTREQTGAWVSETRRLHKTLRRDPRVRSYATAGAG
ncbi:helix-turn-helix DNA binding domain protein [Arthrobacter phage MaGuCo]|uniref:Helix-turn-helix DNA binding domain protein n=1 Tax=Arthrobacter phage MaGuCo TaxID=3038363 RepID=A0AAF0K0H9_9CAUD|nr:helix-turn-helix DNA binding domain protein [Arthrobacter phage MaGuCo]